MTTTIEFTPTHTVNDITEWAKVPGSNTYFRTSDVTPYFSGNTLNIYNARGEPRSWGTPSVRSTVTKLAEDVVSVHVVGWHKHTVSPVGGNFYFVFNHSTGEWDRKTANCRSVKSLLSR